MAPTEMTLKVTFAVWNLYNSHTLGNTARVSYDVFTRELDTARGP